MPYRSAGNYFLTPQEADYLRRSNSYKSVRVDIQAVDSNNPSGDENVFKAPAGDGVLRCRYMRIQGITREERNHSLSMILRHTRHWRRMQSHPSVLDIQGFDVTESNQDHGEAISYLRLVSECPTYTIMDYLASHPQADRLKLCLDISAGLDHIHCSAIIHGAIRPSNILVKHDGTACLGEFADEDIPSQHTVSLYANYIAPELVDIERFYKLSIDNYRDTNYRGEYKMESDIFALGCCMIEIHTGTPPEPLRIPYDKIQMHSDLALLRREPTALEKAVINPKVLSTILAMLRYIPHFRTNSSVVRSWILNPDSLRLGPTVPVLAKRRLWSAFREMGRTLST